MPENTGHDPRHGGAILVLGGYGAVGRHAALALAPRFPGRVVVAGRSEDKATTFASAARGGVTARGVDVDRPAEVAAALDDTALVVMGVERANAAVARACLERGIDYVDVSASIGVLRSIEAMDEIARHRGATAVLSVGISPGLTNLLAARARGRLPEAGSIDISLLLGLGGDHGPDSRRWVMDNLSSPAHGERRRVDLPGFGRRTLHPFPFSDQYTIAETLGVATTTRMAFDSAAVTAAVFGARRWGLFSTGSAPLARLVSAVQQRLPLGADRFVVHAAAVGADGTRVEASASSSGEAAVTGTVAAHVAGMVLDGKVPAGVHHIDRLPSADAILDGLHRLGVIRLGPALQRPP